MPMITRTGILVALGAIALSAALAPSARRAWQQHREVQRLEAARAALANETAAQKAALAERRDVVLAELSALQGAGKHDEVMRLASRYRLADDADIQSIFRLSAAAVSQRQTLERMRALAATQCSADAAIVAVQALDAAPAPAPSATAATWSATALPLRDSLGAIRAQIRRALDTPRHEGESEHAPHGEHAPRLHPFVIQSLLNEQETGVVPACVWRVARQASATAPTPTNAWTIWLAPSANERTLDFGVLAAPKPP